MPYLPCCLGASLLLSLLSPFGLSIADAQQPAPQTDVAPIGTLSVPINITKRVELTNKELIREVRNENPKAVRVQTIVDDPRAVMVTGLNPGTSRLTFVDVNKVIEQIDVRVPDALEADLELRRNQIVKFIREIVPTAVVEVLVNSPNTATLTGTVPDTGSVQIILEQARSLMGGGGAIVVSNLRVAGVQQVQLEVVVAVVNRSELRQMSINWGYFSNRFFLSSIIGTGSGSPLSLTGSLSNVFTPPQVPAIGNAGALASTLGGTPNLDFGILGHRGAFLGFLEALRTENLAKVLAEPRIVTLSGRPATITSGGQTPILTSGGVGAPSVQYKDFGTVVNFLPIVLGNGKIHLEVASELSSINAANGVTIASGGSVPTSVPGFSVRRAQASVQIEDGQTLAIGGLIQNTVNAAITKVPVLGDIPYLGVFFSAKNYKEDEEELLILVTPRLVDGMHCGQIPRYLPGRETRSPDDFELFLEGILEAPRGPRHVSLLHYKGAHTLSPNAANYPCAGGRDGGAGCADGQCGVPATQPLGTPAATKGFAATPAPNGITGGSAVNSGTPGGLAGPVATRSTPGGLAGSDAADKSGPPAMLPPVRPRINPALPVATTGELDNRLPPAEQTPGAVNDQKP